MELMLGSCHQNSTLCGGAAVIATIATIGATATSAMYREIAATFDGAAEKCTWVHTTKIGAPTFKVTRATVVASTADLGPLYDVHYQEYTTDAWNNPSVSTSGFPLIGSTWGNLKARMYDLSAGSVGAAGLQ